MWQWERRGIGIERIHLFPGKELLAMWEGLDFPTNICEIVLIKDNGGQQARSGAKWIVSLSLQVSDWRI